MQFKNGSAVLHQFMEEPGRTKAEPDRTRHRTGQGKAKQSQAEPGRTKANQAAPGRTRQDQAEPGRAWQDHIYMCAHNI